MIDDATSVLAQPWAPRLHPMRYEPEPGVPAPRPVPVAARRVGPPVPPDGDDRAAVAAIVTETLRAALEVLDGRRPHSHLSAVFAPRAAAYWRETGTGRSPGRTRLHRVLVCLPRPGVAEVAAVVVLDGGRIRALPARFERTGSTWRCTQLRLIQGPGATTGAARSPVPPARPGGAAS